MVGALCWRCAQGLADGAVGCFARQEPLSLSFGGREREREKGGEGGVTISLTPTVKGSLARTDPKLEFMYSCQLNVRESGVVASTGLPGLLPPLHAHLRVLQAQLPSPCGCSLCSRLGASGLGLRRAEWSACDRSQTSSQVQDSRESLPGSPGAAKRMACRTTTLRLAGIRTRCSCSVGRQCWDGLGASKGRWQTYERGVGTGR
jgi:hypothetical protein